MNRTLIAEIVIPGNPKGKERPRFSTRPGRDGAVAIRTYTPARTMEEQERIAWLVKGDMVQRGTSGDPDPDGSYAVQLRLWELRTNGHQVDADNALKLVCDALNGVTWADDRQVIDMHVVVESRDARSPRSELSIWRLGAGS